MLQHSHAIERHGFDQAKTPVRREHRHPNLERLVCAALSNTQLAETLLCRPELALRKYEVGRALTDSERRMVLSVTGAGDIYEFAGHLHAVVCRWHATKRPARDEVVHERTAVDASAIELSPAPVEAILVS
jgi:hypothetical protein